MAPVETVVSAGQRLDAARTSEAWPAASARSRRPASSLALCNQKNEEDPGLGLGAGIQPRVSLPGGGFLGAGRWRGASSCLRGRRAPPPARIPGGKTGRKKPEPRGAPRVLSPPGVEQGPHRTRRCHCHHTLGAPMALPRWPQARCPLPREQASPPLRDGDGGRGSPTFSACGVWCEAPSFAEWGSDPSSSPQPGLCDLYCPPVSSSIEREGQCILPPWVLTDG